MTGRWVKRVNSVHKGFAFMPGQKVGFGRDVDVVKGRERNEVDSLLVVTNSDQVFKDASLDPDVLKLGVFDEVHFVDSNNELFHSH